MKKIYALFTQHSPVTDKAMFVCLLPSIEEYNKRFENQNEIGICKFFWGFAEIPEFGDYDINGIEWTVDNYFANPILGKWPQHIIGIVSSQKPEDFENGDYVIHKHRKITGHLQQVDGTARVIIMPDKQEIKNLYPFGVEAFKSDIQFHSNAKKS